jgi:uncharacterized membrane protein
VFGKERLEFLVDGIFAIAMTILVLELRPPDLTDRVSVTELAEHLWLHGPSFISYCFSFFVLGVMWNRQYLTYHKLKAVTPMLVVIQLTQLSLAAFFPFSVALLGRYPLNHLSQLIYAGAIMLYAWLAFLFWISADRAGVLVDELTPQEFRKTRGRLLKAALVISAFVAIYAVEVIRAAAGNAG